MKRIAISQRNDPVPGRDEDRDSLDDRIAALVWHLDLLPIPVASRVPDIAPYLSALHIDGVMLTGGRDIGTTPCRDDTERFLLELAERKKIPVFAFCRGLQMINAYQGGSSRRGPGHVACRHPIEGRLFPQGREVNSFHEQVIEPPMLGHELEALACAHDGTVEALRHISLPWLAVMWHPEREVPHHERDLVMIRDHLTGSFLESLP